MKRAIRYSCCSLVMCLTLCMVGEGQVTVSGPGCVVAGTVYQYIIGGHWDSSATMQVSLAGGHLADTSSGKVSMYSGRLSRRLLVVWKDSASNTRSLSVTSSVGNGALSVTCTRPLSPGVIDSACMTQMIGLDSIVGLPVTCSGAAGGTCSPNYCYQWQRSGDRTHWRDIPRATEQNLQLKSPVKCTVYYRRKVTETGTGSIGYSNQAAVFLRVNGELSDSTLK